MSTFLTGATGYLGSYLAAALLEGDETLHVLVRARTDDDAKQRLWRSLQLHLDFVAFREHLDRRIRIVRGDLTEEGFGLGPEQTTRLVREVDSVLHCAASLARRSERSCMNVNLRGTLAVIRLARAAHSDHGLRRFSQVSTVSVAGERFHETVTEDEAVDWNRRDYDAYGRTKKFAEHMVRELLPDVPLTIFRPSIVLGDSRRAETTQFDMVRAFSFLAQLPVLPLRPGDRIDIVPVDWVSEAIAELHRKESPDHDTYHLSAGRGSETYAQLTQALADSFGTRPPRFAPALAGTFFGAASAAGRASVKLGRSFGRNPVSQGARLLDVFAPYLRYDTVFANDRAVVELGRAPEPCSRWCAPLLRWARERRFSFPYAGWPVVPEGSASTGPAEHAPERLVARSDP